MTNRANGTAEERWAVVINRSAGGNRAGAETLVESLKELFGQEGLRADFHLVAGAELEGVCRAALREGVIGIVAGGGDGTLSTAAAVLAHGEVPLGVLPLGTLNHFAKDLGIPLELPAAVRVVAEGHLARIDLGEVNGTVFINNSSIGGYPRVIRMREHHRRHLGRPKWTALMLAFLRFLQRFRVMKVLLHLDGSEVSRQTPFVFVGNNEYVLDETLGVGRRSLSNGSLCLYTARCDHWMQFVRLFGLLLTNRLADAPEFEAHCVEEARVQTRRNHQDVSRDGEIFRMEMPLHYQIRPRALTVLVPANSSMG